VCVSHILQPYTHPHAPTNQHHNHARADALICDTPVHVIGRVRAARQHHQPRHNALATSAVVTASHQQPSSLIAQRRLRGYPLHVCQHAPRPSTPRCCAGWPRATALLRSRRR
jgi:hypothetical protein